MYSEKFNGPSPTPCFVPLIKQYQVTLDIITYQKLRGNIWKSRFSNKHASKTDRIAEAAKMNA
jgi:hypothetical protein